MFSHLILTLVAIAINTVQPVQAIQQPDAIEIPTPEVADEAPNSFTMSDTEALQAVKLDPDDSNALLKYIRLRTLNDIDLSSIGKVIQQLGDDDFDIRLAAQQRLINFGPAASGPLHKVIDDTTTDPEIAYRAQKCLDQMEQIPQERVSLAVVRRLAVIRPPTTAKVLLDYLPLANDRTIQAQIQLTLKVIARESATPVPALIDALNAKAKQSRLAAALALIQANRLKDQPEVYKTILATAQRETDSSAQFQMVFALAQTMKEPLAVETILRILPELPHGRLWQAEDFLLQLAGDKAPKATFGQTKQSVQDAAQIWQRWWQEEGKRLDLAQFTYQPRTTGRLLLSLHDPKWSGEGKLMELNPDMNVAWEIDGLSQVTDMLKLPNGSIAIAEPNASRVTIRSTQGDILRTMSLALGNGRQTGNPQKIQLLHNGNILVVCRNEIVEFKKGTDEVVMTYLRPTYDIASAIRLNNGETMVICQRGSDYCLFLDKNGKEIQGKTVNVTKPSFQADLNLAGDDHVILTELSRIAEYDLKTGKLVWSIGVNRPTNVQRLFNGHTLIVKGGDGEVVEVDAEGNTVWSYKSNTGKQVYRARAE